MALDVGQPAPEFELPDQDGKPVRLSEHRGRPVVIFFYPRDDTPTCTKESCGFRDAYADFEAHGATVLGVSADATERHARFAEKHSLPYRLLSDRDRAVSKAFGIPQRLGIIPARMTFVLDAHGVVRHVTHADFDAGRHVKEAKEALAELLA